MKLKDVTIQCDQIRSTGPRKLRIIFPHTSVLSKPPQLPYGASFVFGGALLNPYWGPYVRGPPQYRREGAHGPKPHMIPQVPHGLRRIPLDPVCVLRTWGPTSCAPFSRTFLSCQNPLNCHMGQNKKSGGCGGVGWNPRSCSGWGGGGV